MFFFLLSTIQMHASWADSYRYKYYGISEGLCDDYVTATYQDRSNYLWICTSNGLDRFDGNRFVHFSTHSEYEDTRIHNDFIYNVTEDNHNRIWGVTNTGLFRIDELTGEIRFPQALGTESDRLAKHMNGITTDKSGNLLILRPDGLTYVVLDDTGEISLVNEVSSTNTSIRNMAVQDDLIWIGGLSGIECFRKGYENSITSVPKSEFNAISEIRSISTLLVQGNYLWIGTENGLFCYNTQEKTVDSWKSDKKGSSSLSDDHVTCLATDLSGDLLIGTIKGIDRFSRNGEFLHMQPGRRGQSLNTEYVNHILLSKDGTLWVSTLTGGVNQISPKHVEFEDMLTVTEGSPNIISCVFEDKDGNILMGVLGKGLGIRKAGSDKVSIHSLKSSGISQEDIFTIRQDKNGDYWMASRNDGLLFLSHKDLNKPVFTSYNINNSSINSNVIYDLDYDSKRSGIWLTTVKSLYFMDVDTRTPTLIRLSTNQGNPMRYHNVMLGSNDILWIGGYGLCRIDLSQNASVSDVYKIDFVPSIGETDANRYERITSVAESPSGRIFIGSQSNGVYVLNEKGIYTPIPIVNQVFHHRITKLQTDDSGDLWIGTTDGIYHYAPENHLLTRFSREDGLQSTSCYINSGFKLSNGRIAFGTANGLLMFDAQFEQTKTHDRKVAITGIVYRDRLDLRQNISTLDIYPDRPFFILQFSSLDISNESRSTYAYKIDGESDQWTTTDAGSVRYNNLKPGTYTFRVKCTNRDNSWSSDETLLKIKVHPKFYQTQWFWGILLLLLTGFISYIVYLKIKTQNTIQKELTAQVEEKTADLKRQNVLLEEQKEKLTAYSRQVEKINREKLMMYTNLTHEFKTPLTLIMGPVSELEATNKDKSIAPALQIINRNSKHLLQLVNQVLDLRRVDDGKITVKKESFNIARLQDIYNLDFSTILKERNVTFHTMTRLIHKHILSDKDIIHKILSNLISNAVKHTPAGGFIVLRMAQTIRKKDGQMMQYLSVTNTGSYIRQEEFENIFECFYKIENQPVKQTGLSSSGIGLYLVKQLVTDLGGEIRLKSSPQTGTSFRVIFPVDLVESEPAKDNIELPPPPENPDTPVLLLVEDNDDMRAYIRNILSVKYHIVEAPDGETGYEIAKKLIPDFIISDYMMPGMNGIELCRKMREDRNLSHIPFLMLTALSNDNVRTESYKEGVDAFLVKPFKKEMLIARIESILANRHRQQDEVSFDLRTAYDKVNIEKRDKVFMENLLAIMKDNYSNPDFNVPQLQSQMCMSTTSFYKKITALTGLTPAIFIRLYRLQTARNILESHAGDSSMNVSEIAYTVGFNDPKYFSKCFQNQYNILPSAILQGEKQ